jgi:hypothetical protein
MLCVILQAIVKVARQADHAGRPETGQQIAKPACRVSRNFYTAGFAVYIALGSG